MIKKGISKSPHRIIVIYDYYKGTFIPFSKNFFTESGARRSSNWAKS